MQNTHIFMHLIEWKSLEIFLSQVKIYFFHIPRSPKRMSLYFSTNVFFSYNINLDLTSPNSRVYFGFQQSLLYL